MLARRLTLSGISIPNVRSVGITLYDASGNQLARKTEVPDTSASYIDIWYDVNGELGVTLTPGTTYQYRFEADVAGQLYTKTDTFTTSGTAPQPQPQPPTATAVVVDFDAAGGSALADRYPGMYYTDAIAWADSEGLLDNTGTFVPDNRSPPGPHRDVSLSVQQPAAVTDWMIGCLFVRPLDTSGEMAYNKQDVCLRTSPG